jgi:glutaredoxin-like protein
MMSETVRTKAAEILTKLPNPVRLVVFTQENECRFCKEAREMAQELAGLTDKLSVEVYDLQKDSAKAAEYGVDKMPAICVTGDKNYGIRYYGVPAGFEFSTLLALIELVGRRDSGLKSEARAKLAGLSSPIDLQVFVTLTCPVCPLAAGVAASLAVESDNISLSIIDAGEFPQLAGLYNVMAVPKTVVNRGYSFEGALPEERYIDEVIKGADAKGKVESGNGK